MYCIIDAAVIDSCSYYSESRYIIHSNI